MASICRPGYSSLSSHKYTPRRAVLYVPGNDEKKIKKIPSLKVDCAVLDCEDGVAENKKVLAWFSGGGRDAGLEFGALELVSFAVDKVSTSASLDG